MGRDGLRIEDSTLEMLLSDYLRAKERVKENEKVIDSFKQSINEHMPKYREDTDTNKFLIGDYIIQFIRNSRPIIKREKLLERGVSPEIIAYSTEATEYESLRVTTK